MIIHTKEEKPGKPKPQRVGTHGNFRRFISRSMGNLTNAERNAMERVGLM